jgi:hypothetical protein
MLVIRAIRKIEKMGIYKRDCMGGAGVTTLLNP